MASYVAIRAFTEDDIPNKVRWINDPANNKYLHYDLPLEINKTRDWFLNNKGRTDRFDAVITYDGTPVGVIGLLSIEDGSAEYYITLGEKEYLHRGIAKKASELLLDYAFENLFLQKVFLYTEIENLGAQELFERCGFVRFGIAKESATNRGRSVDRYYYEISRDRYIALYK